MNNLCDLYLWSNDYRKEAPEQHQLVGEKRRCARQGGS